MFLLIPALAFSVLWAVFVRSGMGVRAAFLAANVINGVLIVFVTETLSAFQALTFWPLVIFWSMVLLVNLAFLYRLHERAIAIRSFEPLDGTEVAVLIAVGIILALTGLIALVAPPNDNDSMIYHMARVAHWAYNGSVANYPTHLLRQLVMLPYGEYAILQTYILSGSDRFANLVQWGSLAGSLAGVSLITEMLGGPRRVQLLAVLFAVTLPMGILQASSTQNDLVVTLWAVCVVVFALLLVTTGKRGWGILCALGLGLATLTKGIAVIVSAPFFVWALFRVHWKLGQKFWLGLVVAGVVVVMNISFISRLTELSPEPYKYMANVGKTVVDSVDVRGLISNAVRGLATALAAPIPGWKDLLNGFVMTVQNWLGLDKNDPRYTMVGSKFFLVYWPYTEEFATSFIHSVLYLLVAVAGLAFFIRRFIPGKRRPAFTSSGNTGGGDVNPGCPGDLLTTFVAVFLVSFLIFCALVKWQSYIARFHLPFFVLFSSVATVLLFDLFRRTWPLMVAGGLMFAVAWLPLLYNQQHPVLPSWGIKRSSLETKFAHGREIYGWLLANGFLKKGNGPEAFLNPITPGMQERLKSAYPAEFAKLWPQLRQAVSYPQGLFSLSREDLQFGSFGQIARDEFAADIDFMRRQLALAPACRDVGYFAGPIQYEYPLWSLLNSPGRKVRIEHVQVQNESARVPYPRGEPEPCLIVMEGLTGPDMISYRGRTYRRSSPGPMQVYVEEHNAP